MSMVFKRFPLPALNVLRMYHNSAIGYGRVARQIDNVLTTGSGATKDELIKKCAEIETKYDAVESQATELPRKVSESAYDELASRSKAAG